MTNLDKKIRVISKGKALGAERKKYNFIKLWKNVKNNLKIEAYLETCQTSILEFFLWIIFTKKSYMFERILNTSLNNIKSNYHKIPNFQQLANSSAGLKTFQHSRSSHKTEIYTAINIFIYLCIIVSLWSNNWKNTLFQ